MVKVADYVGFVGRFVEAAECVNFFSPLEGWVNRISLKNGMKIFVETPCGFSMIFKPDICGLHL